MSARSFFVTAAKGLETLVRDELVEFGIAGVRETRAGVACSGSLADAYRVCLWSRFASRVLLTLARFPVASADDIYRHAREIDWAQHLTADSGFAIDANASGAVVTHAHFAALKLKDAIADWFVAREGRRPNVVLERPDVRFNLHIDKAEAVLSLDLSGDSLHRRGYRAGTVLAPLKENLAAAILARADWPMLARSGAPLVDPLCGSGTFLIEAAFMAGDIAPNLAREYFGFLGWRGHDAAALAELHAEAALRREQGYERIPPIVGFDDDKLALRAARENVARAGVADKITLARRAVSECIPVAVPSPGLVIANPPYGERLGAETDLAPLYRALGQCLRAAFPGWRAAVFTGNPPLGRELGLRARKTNTFFNGAIECRLLQFEVAPQWFEEPNAGARLVRKASAQARTPGAEMFANRLQKNLKALSRWATREDVACYRLYDADMPEYALALDLYQGDARYLHVQEYAAPPTVAPERAKARLSEALSVLPDVLGLPPEQIFFKRRQRQKGSTQYEKLADARAFHVVREGPCRFWVNFIDYLDTGLFLDHRPTRAMVGALAAGKRFLNLFCYTGTASAWAARSGALASTSVDMSRTYLDWAGRNFDLNGVEANAHTLVQADVMTWLPAQRAGSFDVVFLDPPTFSTSKRMEGTLDIQRDHAALIDAALRLLARDGVLIFSTNARRFKLDAAALQGAAVEDISAQTIPHDFARNPKIHRCFRIRHRNSV